MLNFEIQKLNFSNNVRILEVVNVASLKSRKSFPVFLGNDGHENIFKPLSKTKPLSTPFFALSEVFWSSIFNFYFNKETPKYKLAITSGMTDTNEKYLEHGVLVPSVLKEGQRLVNLVEYYNDHSDPNINVSNYVNYCNKLYSYRNFYNAEPFKSNTSLSEQLAEQQLLSMLSRNQNFHYENISFIMEGDNIVSLCPPIDNEFSLFFMYTEGLEDLFIYHLNTDISLKTADGLLHKELSNIAAKHPEVLKTFLKNTLTFIDDIKNSNFEIPDTGYNYPCSSDDWKIGEARIKQGDEEAAQFLERSISQRRELIDLKDFSKELKSAILEKSNMLVDIISKKIPPDSSLKTP